MENLTNSQKPSSLKNCRMVITVIDSEDFTVTGKRVLYTMVAPRQSYESVVNLIKETLMFEVDCEILDCSLWEVTNGVAELIRKEERHFLYQDKFDRIQRSA